jgi:hypothetical protein
MVREIVHPDEAHELRFVLERLRSDFPNVPAGAIESEVRDAIGAFERATVRNYVPLLVERDVRSHLRRPRAANAA